MFNLQSLAAALPCKTPVSLLQELCMRRGISPKYDLLQIEGAVHEPTFVYRVTVGEFIGEFIVLLWHAPTVRICSKNA